MKDYIMYTYDEDIFSDMFKDAFGFRPRGHRFYDVDTTPAEKQEIWDSVYKSLQEENARHEHMQQEAIKEFEARVTKCIELGAKTRAKALKWIFDAEDDITMYEDKDYFCYEYNLPYGYFNKEENQF